MYKNSPTPALPGEDEEEEAHLADGMYFGRQGIPGTAQKAMLGGEHEESKVPLSSSDPSSYDSLNKR